MNRRKIKYYIFYGGIMSVLLVSVSSLISCFKDSSPDESENYQQKSNQENENPEFIGSISSTTPPDVIITQHATKICQLTGNYDRHLNIPTLSQTLSRYLLEATDLGIPFQDGDTTWLFFGDTWGFKGNCLDVVGYTTDKTPEDGLKLDFITDREGVYQPIHIPGISQGAFEVPVEGIVLDNEFYVWHTTDHSEKSTMGRCVLANASRDNALKGQYTRLYDYSTEKFINVSAVKVRNSDWDLLPQNEEDGFIIFGSGNYRASQIYLCYFPAKEIKNKHAIRYFAGMNNGKPLWNKNEADAQPIFKLDKPGVGELSASYNKFIKKWILLYNHGEPRGINLCTADSPWGPWSEAQVVFRPWEDGGYCHFMHTSYEFMICDSVHDPGRENEWGGEYGPYQFEHFAVGDAQSTTIYFTMSTWNPYQVILMKARLKKEE